MAFEAVDLQCKPIYLGYCKKEKSFWFYALKEKVPRFLKYISYFHWDRGPQEVLEMKPLPEEVELELKLFLEGKLGYEFRKKRKNSKEAIAFKVYQLPEEVGEPLAVCRRRKKGDPPSIAERGPDDSGRSLSGLAVVERKDATDASLSRRGAGRPRHDKSTECPASGSLPALDLAAVTEVLPQALPVTPEPKRRGRPPKIQVVSIVPTIISSNIVEAAALEPKDVTSKRNPRKSKQPKDGLELGVVELLTVPEEVLEVTTRKKRGRPAKVK